LTSGSFKLTFEKFPLHFAYQEQEKFTLFFITSHRMALEGKMPKADIMKVVLVFPPFYLDSMYNLPPLGLINLATALKESSHQVVLIDFVLAIRQETLKMGKGIYEDCAERILEEAPDLVGFSAQCTTYPALVQIGEIIKAGRPGVKIIVGGHNASFIDHMTLERYPFIDGIVRGEGEITFKELVSAYEAGKSGDGVFGLTFRRGKDVVRNRDRDLIPNLDDLPLPDYSFLPPITEYRDACELPRSIAILEVGRGCPYRCVYCSESILWGRRTRTFSVSRLVSEMDNLYRNFGAECFLLAYDQFTANRRFVESFCRKIIEEGLNHLPWYCISRLDSVDADLLAIMREAGCESMCYGIDSGSKRTLSFIRKNIDQTILYQRVVETADQGIIPTLSFVIGFPIEEKEDIDETLMLALRAGIVGNNNPLIQLPTVLPGTDLYKQYGNRLVRQVDTYFALGLEFDRGKRLKSDEDMILSDPMIFSSFYNLPCPARPLEELNLIARYFPLIAQFYPKTFLLLSLETHTTISDLFIRWLTWLKGHLKRKALTLSPQDCYLHFSDYVSDTLGAGRRANRPYFKDILKYETIAIEVGKLASEKSVFYIDINRTRDLKPIKNENMIVEEFAFHIPVIIMDLKAGDFGHEYPDRKTLLVFRQIDNVLDVSEINPFTKDFMSLCDGRTTLKTISQELHNLYGQDMKPGDFFDACVEAVQILGKKGFLLPGNP
jgi:radical SAM superfamily enzyme YgiQ (UPF0313 family)